MNELGGIMKTPIILLCIVLLFTATSCCEKTTEVYIDTVATPVFSPKPYMYNMPMKVWIFCPTPGAEIRYTTEGYYTSENSHLYTGPITIDATTTIKAVAFKQGMNHSVLATGNFLAFSDWGMRYYITHMVAEPDTIYADNGLTSSVISVKVVDIENFGVSDQLVEFETNLGHINVSAVTNSLGYARATFTANDVSGIATIRAVTKRYHPDYPDFVICADTAIMHVVVAGVPPISHVELELPTQQNPFPLNVNETIPVRADAVNILWDSVPNGTMFDFYCSAGVFVDSLGTALGNNILVAKQNTGASTLFKADPIPGNGVITATVGGVTETRNIIVNP
jgi:hypothetical protein